MYLARLVGEFLASADSRRILDAKSRETFIAYLLDVAEKGQDIVALEAIKSLAQCDAVESRRLRPMMQRLGGLLSVGGDAGKLAGLRTISHLLRNPLRVSLLAELPELAALAKCENRTLAAMSISVLLKSLEGERAGELLGQLLDLLDELPGPSKEEAIRDCEFLVRRSPALSSAAMKFLWDALREKSGTDLKLAALETMVKVSEIDRKMESVLVDHLCECLEDSPGEEITLRALQILSKCLQSSDRYANCLKHLANRLTLDSALVRAATVTCLGNAARNSQTLKVKAFQLLSPLQAAEEEEVRQRADFYLNQSTDNSLNDIEKPRDLKSLQNAINVLEKTTDFENFDFESVWQAQQEAVEDSKPSNIPTTDSPSQVVAQNPLFTRPEFADLGLSPLQITGAYADLNEPESEVYLSARKLVFENRLAIEIKAQNNLEGPVSDLSIHLNPSDSLPAPKTVLQKKIASGATAQMFLFYPLDTNFLQGDISGILRFKASTSEAADANSYDDEVHFEGIEIKNSDFLANNPRVTTSAEFREQWA